jgi:hypothetical protein
MSVRVPLFALQETVLNYKSGTRDFRFRVSCSLRPAVLTKVRTAKRAMIPALA